MKKEDIDRLLSKEINGNITEEERITLNAWLKESLSDNWQPDIDAAWNKVSTQIKAQHSIPKGITVKLIPWISIAAILIIGIFLSIKLFNTNDSGVNLKAEHSILKQQLPDGTNIVLSHGGSLKFNSKGEERNVLLCGVAHFDVARNENKPFVISANNNKIVVVGTKFDVEALDDYFSVQVYEGVVRVSTENETKELHPGDIIEVRDGETKLLKSEEEAPRWVKEKLLFIDQPLTQVVKDLQRFYGKEIIIEGNDADKCIVSSGFSEETFEEAIKELQQLLRFEVKTINKTTVIYNLNCK